MKNIPSTTRNEFTRCLTLVMLIVVCPVAQLRAGNPLGLTPGVWTTGVQLGSCANLAAFNTTLNNGDIWYDNSDLVPSNNSVMTPRTYTVRLPTGFDPNSTNKYGLITFIDAGNSSGAITAYNAALDAHNVIYIAGQNIGNPEYTTYRYGVAIMGTFRMCELYNIDPNRIYDSGYSGGGFCASGLAFMRSDWFHGSVPWAGSGLPQAIPGVLAPYPPTGAKPSVAMPTYFRTADMTHFSDMNRWTVTQVYRYGRLNFGGNAREILRPGGHTDVDGPGLTDALDFMYHPLVDIIWDRFEDEFLGGNVQAGKVVAGTGWSAISGSVSEGTYAYNGGTNGVLWLKGDGAAVLSKDTFTWQTNYGILLDARLRAELAGGQNQQIGLHIVPSSFTSGTVSNQPGFHLYWCYGQPYRAELIGADGTRKILATWQFNNSPPMNLSASDVTFWDPTAAPDYAGRMQAFRGEDVRLHLSSVGFQVTFNRPVTNLITSYTTGTYGGVVACPDSDPKILQGFWSDVETALVNALPAGTWRLVLSNDGLVSGQPVGNAVVDEIHLVGPTGQQAAPAPVAATAPPSGRLFSWGQIGGAMGYVVQRSDSPDGPFATVSTLVNTNANFTDTNATQTRAYYYRVAAIGSDGSTGLWSGVVPAASIPGLSAAPTFLGCTLLNTNQALLVWMDNANNETGYRVERSPSGMGQWLLISGTLAPNSTNFTDTNLTAATAYDYRVSAVGTNGLSGYATLTLTTPSAISGAGATPTGLTATNTPNNSVALSWNAAVGSAYNVKRGVSASGPFATIAAGLTGVTYTDPLLLPGTYYYVVSSVSGPAESTNSAPISIAVMDTMPPAITVPGTMNVMATSVNGAVVIFATSATDLVSGSCLVTNLPPSGSLFPVGTNVVTATAVDSAGNAATNSFLVFVQPFGTTVPSGYWNADASGVWSNAVFWSGGLVPGANGGAAYFDLVNLTADRTVYLAGGIALSTLSFGDADTASSASWTLDNNGNAGNSLSLSGTTPTINVNALGAGAKVTINANVYGSAGLTKTGPGQLILPLPNYTGNTTVSGGTLTLQGASYASTNFNLASGATLEIYLSGNTLDGPATIFSGTGTLLKTGPGQLIWGAAATTFALGSGSRIDVQNGTFTGGSYGNEVWTNNLSDLNVGGYGTFDGVEANVCVNALTGSGTVKSGFNGSGYLNFTFGVNGGSGTFSGTLSDSTSSGSFVKAGTGTQILTGINTYTGSTTISGGTLQIGDGTADGSIANTSVINDNGTLVYNLLAAQTCAASIGGTGSLTKSGPGTLTLSGANTYTGATTVNAGTLYVSGSLAAGSMVVDGTAGGTLGGSGIINGPVTLQNGGSLQPSTAGGVYTLTLASATAPVFNAGSKLKIRVPTSSTADQIALSSVTPVFNPANLDLTIDTTGLPGNATGLTIVSTARGNGGIAGNVFHSINFIGNTNYTATVHYNTAVGTITVDLVSTLFTVTYNANGGNGSQTDPNVPYTSNAVVTVLGTGTITRPGYQFINWNTQAGGGGTAYNPGNTFSIAANITLYAQWAITTTGFNQAAAGPWDYNTAANWVNNTINGIWNANLTLSANQTVTFATNTALTTGLTFNYLGNYALTLDAAAVGTQTITLGGDIGLNSGGGSANVTIGNSANHLNVDLGGATRTMTIAASRTLTFNDAISGTNAGIIKDGSGTVWINASNSFSGGVVIKKGAVAVATNPGKTAVFGATTNPITLGDAAGGPASLLLGWQTYNNPITLGVGAVGPLTIGDCLDDSGNNQVTVNGGINLNGNNLNVIKTVGTRNLGIGGAAITGNGSLTLSNLNNTAAGTISVSAPVNFTGSITNVGIGINATIISGSIAATVTAVVQNSATAPLLLSGANVYFGNTIISSGTLKLGSASAMPNGSGKGNVLLNPASGTATLDLNGTNGTINGLSSSGAGSSVVDNFGSVTSTLTVGANDQTSIFGGVIQNTGASAKLNLTKTGAGTLTLTGTNSYTGPTMVGAGTLLINGNSSANTNVWTVVSGATLGGTGKIGGVVNYQNGSAASFTVTLTNTPYRNSTYLTFTNAVFMTNLAVRLTLPTTGLSNAIYVLATNYVAPTVNGAFGTPAIVSGSYGPGGAGVVSLIDKNLVLTVTGVVTGPPVFSGVGINVTALTLTVTNGVPNGAWALLQSTNLTLPLSQWITNLTGFYDASGNLTTNILNPATNPASFFILK
jgi:uncharacterized repeat protein (TIGR02543 family)